MKQDAVVMLIFKNQLSANFITFFSFSSANCVAETTQH